MAGIGISRDLDNGTFARGELSYVDYDDVFSVVSAITPVPGGVGPMTIACLLKNTVDAAFRQQ